MLRRFVLFLLVASFLGAGSVYADDFTVKLTVKANKVSKTATTEVAAVGAKHKKRPVLPVKVGAKIVVKWSMANTSKKSFPNILVHFFATKQNQLNQTKVPKLGKAVAAESALTMDFKSEAKATGELNFAVNEKGLYLVRVETIGVASGGNQREYYAALDLVVK